MKKTTKTIKVYETYEEPFNNNGNGRTFTEKQMVEVYRDLSADGTIDRIEYPYFDIWLADMLKSGVFTESKIPDIDVEPFPDDLLPYGQFTEEEDVELQEILDEMGFTEEYFKNL